MKKSIIIPILVIVGLIAAYFGFSGVSSTTPKTVINQSLVVFDSSATQNLNNTTISSAPAKVFTSLQPTSMAPLSISSTASSISTAKALQVFYSKDPASTTIPKTTFGLARTTSRTDIEMFALENLMSGPSQAERTLGYYTPINMWGTGGPSCNMQNFTLTITNKKADVKMCVSLVLTVPGADQRIKYTLNDTLLQFPTITSVGLKDMSGNCVPVTVGNIC
jgi:hypothetical protein